MKVAFWGNTCNNFYAICKILRSKDENYDCHLYLDMNSDIQNLPESENPALINNYPNWIHKDKYWNPERLFRNFDTTFINELKQYDLVFFSGRGVSLIPFLSNKCVFFVTGGDLTMSPFFLRQIKGTFNIKTFQKIIASFFQRKGIKEAYTIITQPFFPFTNALKKIGVKNSRINKVYFPLVIDSDKIKYQDSFANKIPLNDFEFLKKFKLKIFHPSRMMLIKDNITFNTGQWKNNDLLFRAVRDYILTVDKEVVLILIERDFSPDIKLAKELIKSYGIEENVYWLKPTNSQGFTKNELLSYYSFSDVVVDEFGIGWFGSVVLEGLACSKPVICKVDETVMKSLYPWHPVLNAKNEIEILEILKKIKMDEKWCLEIGSSGRKWIEEFHSECYVKKLYADEIIKLLSNK